MARELPRMAECRRHRENQPEGGAVREGAVVQRYLKIVFSVRKYTRRIINSLGKRGEACLIDGRIFQTAEIGRIHAKAA